MAVRSLNEDSSAAGSLTVTIFTPNMRTAWSYTLRE